MRAWRLPRAPMLCCPSWGSTLCSHVAWTEARGNGLRFTGISAAAMTATNE